VTVVVVAMGSHVSLFDFVLSSIFLVLGLGGRRRVWSGRRSVFAGVHRISSSSSSAVVFVFSRRRRRVVVRHSSSSSVFVVSLESSLQPSVYRDILFTG
jgi:hypothetical protein